MRNSLKNLKEAIEDPEKIERLEVSDTKKGRKHDDGEPISENLPLTYQKSSNDGVPENQACDNCRFINVRDYCELFSADVRRNFWCHRFEFETVS